MGHGGPLLWGGLCQGRGMEKGLLLGSALVFLTRAGCQTEPIYSGEETTPLLWHVCTSLFPR